MSFFDTVMSDSVGVLWRGATGTVDPWTKNQLVCCEKTSLIAAGMNPCDAATQAQADATQTLKTVPCGGADPSQAACGLKRSISSAFDLTGNVGKTVLFIAIGAAILYLLFVFSSVKR